MLSGAINYILRLKVSTLLALLYFFSEVTYFVTEDKLCNNILDIKTNFTESNKIINDLVKVIGINSDNAEEYVKELKDMTGLGAAYINKLIRERIRENIEQGIQQGEERSIERLAEFFISKNPELTPEQAKEMATEILREGTNHR